MCSLETHSNHGHRYTGANQVVSMMHCLYYAAIAERMLQYNQRHLLYDLSIRNDSVKDLHLRSVDFQFFFTPLARSSP